MAHPSEHTDYQKRLEIGERSTRGESDQAIAQAMNLSIWTVRKWRRIYQVQGKSGLVTQMGRPCRGALSTYSPVLQVEVEQLRLRHPGWGAKTIQIELNNAGKGSCETIPSRSRIAAFLKEKKLTRPYERSGGVKNPHRQGASQPHEEWQLDAQGRQPVDGLGQVCVINISDVVSRLKTASYPYLGSLGMDCEDYQLVLRWAFLHYGLPQRISLDHDSVFHDNTSRSPFPTRLHQWLIALGIQVVFGRKGKPTDHGIIERTHQTLTRQAIQGQCWVTQKALWSGLDQRRDFLNARYPCRSLNARPPLSAYPQAAHSGRNYRPEWEEDLLDLTPVYQLLATGRWFRYTNLHGEFWLGMQRYNAGRRCAKTIMEVTFDAEALEFIACQAGTENIRRFPAKALTKANLMGELSPILKMPSFQLALPFSRPIWRQMMLASGLKGTTL